MKKILRFHRFAAALALVAAITACTKVELQSNPAATDNIDEWMFKYMSEKYLWNDAVKNVKPDYTLDYTEFLDKVLFDIAAQNDVNREDGHWENGKRTYFYSNIQRYAASVASSAVQKTRGIRKTAEGTGIQSGRVEYIKAGSSACLVRLLTVAPNSPAAAAGLKRGSIITRVNGTVITDSNFQSLMEIVTPEEAGKSMELTAAIQNPVSGELTEGRAVRITSAVYDDNPVWATALLTASNGDKVGYLCYDSFNDYYDEQLMEAFRSLKSRGAGQLVLDLRHNGGGHVTSSLLMGTMIAGPAKKGQTYGKITYNAERTAKGETGDLYKIGDGSSSNAPLVTLGLGSAYAFGLNTVYVLCTENTASASELVVNGLRGLDLDVRLIGATTNGKNVGMEPISKIKDNYEYFFSPITFYSENAKGFKDYSNGFTPDVPVNEKNYAICDWGSASDPLLGTALKWIGSGSKPSAPQASVRSTTSQVLGIYACPTALQGMIIDRGEAE